MYQYQNLHPTISFYEPESSLTYPQLKLELTIHTRLI
jgi:hypothetical protein